MIEMTPLNLNDDDGLWDAPPKWIDRVLLIVSIAILLFVVYRFAIMGVFK